MPSSDEDAGVLHRDAADAPTLTLASSADTYATHNTFIIYLFSVLGVLEELYNNSLYNLTLTLILSTSTA